MVHEKDSGPLSKPESTLGKRKSKPTIAREDITTGLAAIKRTKATTKKARPTASLDNEKIADIHASSASKRALAAGETTSTQNRRLTLAETVMRPHNTTESVSSDDGAAPRRGTRPRKQALREEAAESERDRRRSHRLNRTESIDTTKPGPDTLVELNLRTSSRKYEKQAVIQGNGTPVPTDALFSSQVDNLLAICNAAIAEDAPAHGDQIIGSPKNNKTQPQISAATSQAPTQQSMRSSRARSARRSSTLTRVNSDAGNRKSSQPTPHTTDGPTDYTHPMPGSTEVHRLSGPKTTFKPGTNVPDLYQTTMSRLLTLADRKSVMLMQNQSSNTTLRAALSTLSSDTSEIKIHLNQILQAYNCFTVLEPLQQMSPTFLAVRFIKQLLHIIIDEEQRMDSEAPKAKATAEATSEETPKYFWASMSKVREESGNMINCFLSIAGLLPSNSDYGVKQKLADLAMASAADQLITTNGPNIKHVDDVDQDEHMLGQESSDDREGVITEPASSPGRKRGRPRSKSKSGIAVAGSVALTGNLAKRHRKS